MDNINIIAENFSEMPNAHETGKKHEAWFAKILNSKNKNPLQQHLLSCFYGKNVDVLQTNAWFPDSHVEKSDIVLTSVVKNKVGGKKLLVNGISAKAGKTQIPGHIFSTELNKACALGLAPSLEENKSLHEFHHKWLNEKKKISELDVDIEKLKIWYQEKWENILNITLFGADSKAKATGLLLSNLEVDFKNNNLQVKEMAFLTKTQVLQDLRILSNLSNVQVSMEEHGIISSGIISVQRAGGANGKNPANYWKARMDRHQYLKWLIKNQREEVWTF